MSATWEQRKAHLRALLQCDDNDEEEGIALDRILHGQAVIGKTRMLQRNTSTSHIYN